ncbi:2-oxoglutarate-dependent dioxygenase AOP1.2 [Actinidia chinensis var. chinensis]|uniref:2-oxoglutarate-dependent dioxygenase AOP1.2 n=1 Tax=Actinidia chinensis var. chinensis TaxID=1590841 RepID=A0A2R6PSI2_ACTCC|nr:2-oxoglutarate-dependent dioxygenase AOP1.2 [Actinidia chinensis var. chinensis]
MVVCDEASWEIHGAMFRGTKELFDLPVEIKVQNTSDKVGFGYGKFPKMLQEYSAIETSRETIQSFTDLIWPSEDNTFGETALLYSNLLSELYRVVMRMVFESYGVDESTFEDFMQSTSFQLRFMKYRLPQTNETNTGLPPHTDADFLGILDTNQVRGLEIETKKGEWIVYEPLPSSFLVMAGMEQWEDPCSGASGAHEVRYSCGLFSYMVETVKTPDEFVDEHHPLQYKPFNHFAYLQFVGDKGSGLKDRIKVYCGL